MSVSPYFNCPDFSDDYIELAANTLLRDYMAWCDGDDLVPVRAEVIAEQFLEYTIEITNEGIFSDPECLGGIVFNENCIRI